jgi:tRNA pseudouridine55 synthase
MNGILLINKPVGITSFDCIRQLRRTTGVKKMGHAGTLDPAASGLMILLLGSATKRASEFSKQDKTYVAEITLGATSTTGDREGEIMPSTSSGNNYSLSEVEAALDSFVGEITQTPSIYSAIKVAGKEAYKYARKGQAVEVPSRKVTIYSIKLLEYSYPIIRIESKVSSGTYIRSLAQDIGDKLGTGAYLSALERTSIGEFTLNQAIDLDATTQQVEQALISLDKTDNLS